MGIIGPLMAEGRIGEALKGIFKGGLLRAFDSQIGVKTAVDATPEQVAKERSSRFSKWFKDREESGIKYTGEAFSAALEDPEIQKKGQDFVSEAAGKVVSAIRSNFGEIVGTVGKSLAPEASDTRSTYQRLQALLTNEKDSWPRKLIKSVGALALTWGIPVVSYVGAFVSAKYIEEPKKFKEGEPVNETDSFKNYCTHFENICNGMITRLEPNRSRSKVSASPA